MNKEVYLCGFSPYLKNKSCTKSKLSKLQIWNMDMNWQIKNGNELEICFRQRNLKKGKLGRPAKYDNSCIMNGILWINRNGLPWRKLPERYGKWQAVYAHFRLWNQLEIFVDIIASLCTDADMKDLSIDSTSCKVHQSDNSGKKQKTRLSLYQNAAEILKFMP